MKITDIGRAWKSLKEMPLGEAFKAEDDRYYMKIRLKNVITDYMELDKAILDGTQPIVDIETGDVVWADEGTTRCYLIEATVEVKA